MAVFCWSVSRSSYVWINCQYIRTREILQFLIRRRWNEARLCVWRWPQSMPWGLFDERSCYDSCKNLYWNLIDNSGSNTKLDIQAHAENIPHGVQGWLGWQADVRPEEWARDIKQLPIQRPTKAVNVKIVQKNLLNL